MDIESPRLSSPLISRIIVESWRGKTIGRTLMNHALESIYPTGAILDLGSSTESASYHRFLKYKEPYTLTYTDWYKSGGNMMQLDLEKPFQLESDTFDYVTCFNVLEHLYHVENVVHESHRILKQGGTFIGATPFLVNYHPDPYDFNRPTHEAIEKFFTKAGFTCEKMVSLGFGPLTASLDISFHVFPKFLRPLIACITLFFDSIILRLKNSQRLRYPLGYVFVYKKS